ncbi:hypothetical protein GCM10007972_13140 [Iodidimonas muriae]|uniref:Uncharacterized protein n=1 Tax=Iodidimonas muriae TaxID=261467 RepID=A0ABQ2LD03_9PROT|nr:hypothetical protein JCM17843_09880 [Kordiimonadales bacterium JCM 17843]GGO10394.1 hypothetical protein GCM10007972_13140 [Iodidimonas muriae]
MSDGYKAWAERTLTAFGNDDLFSIRKMGGYAADKRKLEAA